MKPERILFLAVIGITLLISILIITRYFKKDEGFGDFYKTQDAFTKSQGLNFHNKLNKSLPTNTGLQNEMKLLNRTLFSVDTMINKNRMMDMPPFSPEENPLPAFLERNRAECGPIRSPQFLKPHTKNPPTSCGWYYIDDENKYSLATLGTEKGPLDPDFLINHPGGQWVWDNEKAQKLEDAKKCRNLKSCETADIYANECGFCPSLSHGVPIKNGKSKYTDDPNLTCDTAIVTNPALCPVPEPTVKIVITDTGDTLKSGDIYKGEPIPFEATKPGLCDPNPKTGQLNPDCLIAIAKTIGFSEYGVLIKVLLGDSQGYYTRLGTNFDTMRVTKSIMEADGNFKLRAEYFGDGPITRNDVIYGYKKIYEFVKGAQDKRVRNASKWLVFGNEYDPCDYDPDKIGPFEPICQRRVALEAGCQPDGYKFPGPDSWANYNLLKWSAFNQYFQDMYQTLNNKDPKKQRQATLDCLGISVVSDAAILCGDPGAPCKVLTEAEIQRNTAVIAAQSNIDKYKSEIPVAKNPIEKKLAGHLYEEAIKVKAQVLAKIRKVNVCPPNPPIGCWDFSLGRSDDRMSKYGSTLKGTLNYTTLGGKKCAQFKGGNNYISINQPISTRDFKSISMMIYVNSNGPYPRLWDFNNSSLGGTWCLDNLFGCLSPGGSLGVSMYAMTNCNGPSIWTQNNTTPYGKWIHVVWTIDADFSGMSVYLNGQQRARWSDPNGKHWLRDKVYKNAWIMQSPEQFDKDVGVAWFRIFDYTLTAEAIALDMKNSWSFPPLPPLPPTPPTPYEYKGCWGDSSDRAISNYSGQVTNADECYNLAKDSGASVFGLQYYGQCFTGTNKDYNRFGKRDDAGCGPLGSGWTNQVYTLKPTPLAKPITYIPLINDALDYGARKQSPRISGNVQFQTTAGKQCAYFNNNMSTWISVNNAVNQDTFTVCFWMLLKSGTYYTVVSRTDTSMNNPSVQFDMVAGGMPLNVYLALPYHWTSGATQQGGSMQMNIWYHVALVVSKATATLYINGAKQGTATGGAPMPNRDIWLLGRSGDSGRAADVCLRQFALWDYVLSQENINSVLNQTKDSSYLSASDYVAPPAPPAFKGPAACKGLGSPSGDRRIRVYTKAECASLGGNFYSNGECTKREGGSFSWDCRVLN